MRTTSPTPVYRSTRDTRNAPLWNPRSRELLNVEDDEAGKLSAFRSRYGVGFDTIRGGDEVTGKAKKGKDTEKAETKDGDGFVEVEGDARTQQREIKVADAKKEKEKLMQRETDEDDGWDFGEDDENMLDLISRFGQDEDIRQKDAPVVKKKK